MRKKDELTNPNSCMSRAKDDEWTFVLLGRDKAATVAVRAWINERIRLGKNSPGDRQILEAYQWIESARYELALSISTDAPSPEFGRAHLSDTAIPLPTEKENGK